MEGSFVDNSFAYKNMIILGELSAGFSTDMNSGSELPITRSTRLCCIITTETLRPVRINEKKRTTFKFDLKKIVLLSLSHPFSLISVPLW
jgi:hypothetical protein